MSTQTEGCFSRKSSGSSVYGIKWNHISFMALPSQSNGSSFGINLFLGWAGVNQAWRKTVPLSYPGESRDPFLNHSRPGPMGPGFRRDDIRGDHPAMRANS